MLCCCGSWSLLLLLSQLLCMSPSALSTTRTWCFQHRVGQRNSAKSIGPGLFQPTNLGTKSEERTSLPKRSQKHSVAVSATLRSSWQLCNCSCSFVFGFRKDKTAAFHFLLKWWRETLQDLKTFLRFTGPAVASDECRGTVGVDHFFELPAVLKNAKAASPQNTDRFVTKFNRPTNQEHHTKYSKYSKYLKMYNGDHELVSVSVSLLAMQPHSTCHQSILGTFLASFGRWLFSSNVVEKAKAVNQAKCGPDWTLEVFDLEWCWGWGQNQETSLSSSYIVHTRQCSMWLAFCRQLTLRCDPAKSSCQTPSGRMILVG